MIFFSYFLDALVVIGFGVAFVNDAGMTGKLHPDWEPDVPTHSCCPTDEPNFATLAYVLAFLWCAFLLQIANFHFVLHVSMKKKKKKKEKKFLKMSMVAVLYKMMILITARF